MWQIFLLGFILPVTGENNYEYVSVNFPKEKHSWLVALLTKQDGVYQRWPYCHGSIVSIHDQMADIATTGGCGAQLNEDLRVVTALFVGGEEAPILNVTLHQDYKMTNDKTTLTEYDRNNVSIVTVKIPGTVNYLKPILLPHKSQEVAVTAGYHPMLKFTTKSAGGIDITVKEIKRPLETSTRQDCEQMLRNHFKQVQAELDSFSCLSGSDANSIPLGAPYYVQGPEGYTLYGIKVEGLEKQSTSTSSGYSGSGPKYGASFINVPMLIHEDFQWHIDLTHNKA